MKSADLRDFPISVEFQYSGFEWGKDILPESSTLPLLAKRPNYAT